MRFAKEQGIPAQGRGSATSSIVSYTLGISRVEPIAHNLLFERFINPGRTTYPDVDIDFSSERREEVIQYVYDRYGPEHTGMVCNLVTYRARSAVREVGYALGFPRPLVDRVAKALETYDSVMVRRDLEADGGFAEFFRRPGEGLPAEARDRRGRPPRRLGFVDGMGQLNTRMPLVGKVPPWRQPPKPEDPNAPRPFAWLRETAADPTGQGGAGGGRVRARTDPAPRRVRPGPIRHRPCPARPVRHRRVRPGRSGTGPSETDHPAHARDGRPIRPHDQPARRTVPMALQARSMLLGSSIGSSDGQAGADGTLPAALALPAALSPVTGSGREAGPTTRVARATPRPASPGCGRAAGPATRPTRTGSSRRRSSTAGGSIPRAVSSNRRRARPTAATRMAAEPPTSSAARPAGIRRRRAAPTRAPRRPTPRSPGSSRSRHRRPVAARPSASPTGSAGSSSAPGSTASRAICRSIRAGCW